MVGKKMKILFIGTVHISEKLLQKLISMKSNIVGVCTKKSSSFNSDFVDLTLICKKNEIPYRFVNDINSPSNLKWIKNKSPDVIFCFGWSDLLKDDLLKLPPIGVIGYHPAKLPQNRGRHPIIWTLVLGLSESSSTFFFMDKGVDDGDILSQKDIKVLKSDNAETLYNRLINVSVNQIEKIVSMLETNNFRKIKQNHSLSNTWRKRSKDDGKINFKMTSKDIHNLVRALSKPYIGAHINYKNKDIIVWRTKIIKFQKQNIEPGKVLISNKNSITVKSADGAIEIIESEFVKFPKKGEYL